MKKILFVLTVILSAAVFCQAEGAPPMPPQGFEGSGHGMSILNMVTELDLSGAQVDELKKLEKASAQVEEKLFREHEKYFNALRDEMDRDKPDEGKLDAVVDQISDFQKQLLKNKIKDMLATNRILSKDQIKKLKDMMEKRMKGFGPRGDKGRSEDTKGLDGQRPPPDR